MRPNSRVTFSQETDYSPESSRDISRPNSGSRYESRPGSRPGTQETAHSKSRRQSLAFNYAAAFSDVSLLDMHTLNEASLEVSNSITVTNSIEVTNSLEASIVIGDESFEKQEPNDSLLNTSESFRSKPFERKNSESTTVCSILPESPVPWKATNRRNWKMKVNDRANLAKSATIREQMYKDLVSDRVCVDSNHGWLFNNSKFACVFVYKS